VTASWSGIDLHEFTNNYGYNKGRMMDESHAGA